ncbi:MAG: hypothetical protein ACUVUE_06460 [Candidatus Bathycorpusculaceae bacterium]
MACSNAFKRERTRIVVSRFGTVESARADYIQAVMRECYLRLEPHDVSLVDLYIFEKSSSLEAFIERESKEIGVASESFSGQFFAMHAAYRGIPRISVCLERMKHLPELVQEGGIRHEVGHSVLHGSLLYYLLPFPQALSELVARQKISQQYAFNLLYLTSIAVKDYEVSRLLRNRGFIEDQIVYSKHLLTFTEDDMLSWEISRNLPQAKILYLVSCLKTAACAIPFLADKEFGNEIEREIKENLSYLPASSCSSLFKIVFEDFPSLGEDTLCNIDNIVLIVVDRIVKPNLGM